MDWIIDNWPIALAAAGAFVIVAGLVKKLIKMAIFGIVLIVLGVVLLQVFAG